MKAGLFFLLLALLPYFQSCATLPRLPERTPLPHELMAKMEDRAQKVRGLKGLAHVRVSSAGKNFSAPEVLWVRRPSFLRVESLGPLGTPQLYMVTDGRRVNLYVPSENRYYDGPANGALFSFALPVTLPPGDAVALLLGEAPGIKDEAHAWVRRDPEEGLWVLDGSSPSGREERTLWIDPKSDRVIRGEIRRGGDLWKVSFEDFHPVRGVLMPRRIELFSQAPAFHIVVQYEEMELNPPWEDQDFILPVPRGATIVPWP
jgi:outer membrane lipoprotein-sorting protein